MPLPQQPKAPRAPEGAPRYPPRECGVCRAEFVPRRKNQKYCSPLCGKTKQQEYMLNLSHVRQGEAREKIVMKCKICEKEFVARHVNNTCCSPLCARESLKLAVAAQQLKHQALARRKKGVVE